jgi:DNA-binding MarR family transcriptional regulator
LRHIPIEYTRTEVLEEDQRPEPDLEELLVQLEELSSRLSTVLLPQQPRGVDGSSPERLVSEILRFRKQRNRAFGHGLFGEPAWDILLELYTAERTGRKLSVSGACYVSGVPLSTALRWISRLEREGWILRTDDPQDKRRSWLTLSEDAERKMGDLLSRMAA